MSENRKVGFVVAAENETKQTFDEIKRDANSMAQAVEQSGKRAAKGMQGVGDGFKATGKGAPEAAGKVDAATRSLVNSIQRATAAAEAGEKGTSKYFEYLAKQRGVGGDVLEPYLAQMRKAEAAQAASVKGLGSMEMSAKQTAAALRGVPAQFTDIMVSLQGGQAPLTVFLQQGGQLKDMFGGAGAAAKALGGYIMSLISPAALLAAGVGAVAMAYYQGSKEQDAWVKSIVLTGNAAGVTTGQLREYAREMSSISGTQGAAAASLNAFVAAGVRGGDELKRYAQTAIDWEKATGESVDATAKKFAELQKEPLNAVLKLNEGTNFLTVSVYEQIKALTEQGEKAEASRVAMNALDDAIGERSKAIENNLGHIERGWNSITSAAAKAWNAMLNVGRAAAPVDMLSEVQQELADLRARSGAGFGETGGGAATGRASAKAAARIQERIAALEKEERQLLAGIDAEQKKAAAQEESTRITQSRLDFDKKYGDALKSEVTLQQKLAIARKEAESAGKSEAEIKKVLTWVTEEHNKSLKKGNDGRKAAETSYQTLMAAINKSIAAAENEVKTGEKLTESQKLRIQYEQELATRKRAFSAEEKKSIETALLVVEAAEQQAHAFKALSKAWEEDAKALDTYIKKQEAQIAAVTSSVSKLRLEEEAHMLAAAANISHAEAVERITIARLEEAQAQMLAGAGSQEEIERINREIAARKELLGLLGQRAAREANAKAAKDAEKVWDRTAQTVGDTLADYIMGGGKDAAQYLERLFSTLVLQPVVQAAVGGVLGTGSAGASGALSGGSNGLGSLLNAASGGAGLGGMIAGVGGMLNIGGITAFGSGMAAGGSLGLTAGLGQGLSMLGAGAGGTAAGLGTMLGAAMPWIGGALAVASLLKGAFSGEHRTGSQYGIAYDGAVTNNRRGQTYTNDGQNYRSPNGTGAALENGRAYWLEGADPSAADSSIAAAIEITAAGIDGLFEMLGSSARLGGFWAGLETSGKGRGGVMSGGRLADGTLFGEDGTGDNYAGTLYEKFSSTSPDFEKALEDFELDLKQVTLQALQAADDLPASIAAMLDGVETELMAEDAVDALLVKIQSIAVGAAALGNALGLMDLATPAGNLIDFTAALSEFNGGLDNSLALLNGFYGAFYSEEERMRAAAEQMRTALAGLDLGIDPMLGEDAKAQYRAAVNAALAAGDAELYAALLNLSGSFASIADYAADAAKAAADAAKKAAEDARQALIDSAWANLEAAVDRESALIEQRLSAVQESIGILSGMQSMLKTSADSLYGGVDQTAQMRAVDGMLYVETALDAVRRGASLTGFDGLSDAVTAARAGLSTGVYASQFEKDRDALVLAGQLSELEGVADLQLSVEERQLKALNEQLEHYQRMLDTARDAVDGINTLIDKTLTPEAAYDILMRVRKGEAEGAGGDLGKPAAGGGGGDSPSGVGTPIIGPRSAEEQAHDRRIAALMGDGTAIEQVTGIKDAIAASQGTGDVQGLWDAIVAAGGNQYDAAWFTGYAVEDIESVLKGLGVPGFANGGMHSGGLRLVGERGPELEVTGPARYFDTSKTMQMLSGGGNDALVAEVRALREDNRAQAGEIVRLNARVARLLERWDGGGIPRERQEAAI